MRRRAIRWNSILLVVLLIVIAVGLGWLTVMTAQAAAATRDQDQALAKRLGELAWLSLALLGMTLILLLWSVMKLLRGPFVSIRRHEPTPYVDAWSEAGQRLKIDDTDRPGESSEKDGRNGPDTGER